MGEVVKKGEMVRAGGIALLSLLVGCASQGSAANPKEKNFERRDVEIHLEECATDSKGAILLDADGDGRPEIVRVMDGEREVCRTVDLNFDGRLDRTTFFTKDGKVRRVESDFDRDGAVDEIALFEGGKLVEKRRAMNLDRKLDTWDFFQNGRLIRTERDEDGDAVIDQWWEYPRPGCPMIHVDRDGDGRPDPGASLDYCEATGTLPTAIEKEKQPLSPKKAREAPEELREDDAIDEAAGETKTGGATAP